MTLFCTQEHGLLLQDCFPKPSGLQALLAVEVPYYYFSCKVRTEHSVPLVHCVFTVVEPEGGPITEMFHCSSSLQLFLSEICLVLHIPAIISEGTVLSTRSKCLWQCLKQASVFSIQYLLSKNCALRNS